MPREFIANVEDANNELVRLDGQIDTITKDLNASKSQVTTLTQTIKDLTSAKESAEGALQTAKDQHAKDLKAKDDKIVELGSEVDKQKGLATKAAAAAGVELKGDEFVKTGLTDASGGDKSGPQLTGLTRAIAANKEAQAAKK